MESQDNIIDNLKEIKKLIELTKQDIAKLQKGIIEKKKFLNELLLEQANK